MRRVRVWAEATAAMPQAKTKARQPGRNRIVRVWQPARWRVRLPVMERRCDKAASAIAAHDLRRLHGVTMAAFLARFPPWFKCNSQGRLMGNTTRHRRDVQSGSQESGQPSTSSLSLTPAVGCPGLVILSNMLWYDVLRIPEWEVVREAGPYRAASGSSSQVA